MKKVVFFDLDGTLLNTKKEVLEENKQAIKRAKDAGIEVAICTGRQANAAREFKEMAESGKYVICTNGAEIVNMETGEELFSSVIEEEIAKVLYNYAKENNFIVKIDTKYARYINKIDYALNQEYEFNEDENKFFNENGILQISFGAKTKEEIDIFEENIVNKISGIKVYNKYYNTLPSLDKASWYINVVNSSVSKGNAVNGLCRYLNVNLSDVACFGDDLNDISMIEMAGHGIAMGNALEVVKKCANEIIGDNNTPAIAEVLDRFIIENKEGIING